jgi:apolipoprotein N-acyltransferase
LVGFGFWLAALHWLRLPHEDTKYGWLALSFYLAFYLPMFVGLARVAVHRLGLPVILAAPVVWTGLELARAHLLTGFTMASLGHTQYEWIELIQISDLAGAYGVSFVVMFVAACLARMVPVERHRHTFWPLLPTLALVVAVLVYGQIRMTFAQRPPLARIALIQGSIDTKLKAAPGSRDTIHEHYRRLSEEAVAKYAPLDLIIWPETMFRDTLIISEPGAQVPEVYKEEGWTQARFDAALQEKASGAPPEMSALARTFGVPMLVGVECQNFGPDGLRYFNSAACVSSDGELLGRYCKNHLVMFGEYVPFAWYFPWLQRLTPLPVSLSAGSKPASFQVDGLRLTPNICFETVIPHVIRRQIIELRSQGAEPDVLVNLTNDGWFWGSSELDMHLICGVFRAVECRKPLLIAANTGFSAWIDANGRILRQGPRRATGKILAEVGRDPRQSWYLRHGDWLAGLCLAGCLVFALVGCWNWARQRWLRTDGSSSATAAKRSADRKSRFGSS